MFFGDAFYIALISFEIRSTIACQATYYYLARRTEANITLDEGIEINTTDSVTAIGKRLDKIVIYYDLICHVEIITLEGELRLKTYLHFKTFQYLTFPDYLDELNTLTVHTKYFNGLREFRRDCKFKMNTYICGRNTRMVVVELKSQLIQLHPQEKSNAVLTY